MKLSDWPGFTTINGSGVGGWGHSGTTTITHTFDKDCYWLSTSSLFCTNGHRDGEYWITDSNLTCRATLTLKTENDTTTMYDFSLSDTTETHFTFVPAGSVATLYVYFSGGNHNGFALTGTYIYAE